MTTEPNQEKPSSDALTQVLARLSIDQIRFIVARQEFATDKEAAVDIGLKPDTVYQWKHKGHPIDEAVRLMALDGVIVARHLRRRNLAKAMAVKIAGLDDDDDKLRQSVATEIIEWEMGKATQPQTHAGPDGGPIQTQQQPPDFSQLTDDELDRYIAITRKLAESGEGEE